MYTNATKMAFAAVLSALLSGVAALAPQPSFAAPPAPGQVQGSACSDPVPLTSASHMTLAGVETSEASDSTATVYRFQEPGTSVTSIVPPANWSPLEATDTQLALFGFPARPKDGSGLERWEMLFKKFKAVVIPSFCHSDRVVTPPVTVSHATGTATPFADVSSRVWTGAQSGGAANSRSEAGAYFIQPSFVAACPSASSWQMWAGIGSKGTIIQTGTDVDPTGGGPNTIQAWVEYYPGDNIVIDDMPISPNDDVSVQVVYEASDQTATTSIFDGVTGEFSSVISSLLGGETAADAYGDGSQGEIITERSSHRDSVGDVIPYLLRKPEANIGRYLNTEIARSSLSLLQFDTLTMATTDVLADVENLVNDGGDITWDTVWKSCS